MGHIGFVKFSTRLLALGVVTLLLSSCVTSPTVIGQSWLGETETILLSKWGAPTRTVKTDGTTIHTWDRRNDYGEEHCEQTMVVRGGSIVDRSTTCEQRILHNGL